jgi:Carbohydrate-binding module 48 (Isoamylase N-terminal domain)
MSRHPSGCSRRRPGRMVRPRERSGHGASATGHMQSNSVVPTEAAIPSKRRFPIGAEVIGDGFVHFRVWAPAAALSELVFSNDSDSHPLQREADGYFSAVVRAEAGAEDRFRLDVDGSPDIYPDPVARFQPRGPHQPSEINRTRHIPVAGRRLARDWAERASRLRAPSGRSPRSLSSIRRRQERTPECEIAGADGVDEG